MGGISSPGTIINNPVVGGAPNSVLYADAARLLGGITGVAGQVVGFGVGGVPQAVAGPSGTIASPLQVQSPDALSAMTLTENNGGSGSIATNGAFSIQSNTNALTLTGTTAAVLQLSANDRINILTGQVELNAAGAQVFLSTGVQTAIAASGASFTANASGAIVNVAAGDVIDFQINAVSAGFVSAAGDWVLGASDIGGNDTLRVNGGAVSSGVVRSTGIAGIHNENINSIEILVAGGMGVVTAINRGGGTLIPMSVQGTSFNFAGGGLYPATDAAASQSNVALYAGSAAPNNANGNNGDIYFRGAGGVLDNVYVKIAGVWTGII